MCYGDLNLFNFSVLLIFNFFLGGGGGVNQKSSIKNIGNFVLKPTKFMYKL